MSIDVDETSGIYKGESIDLVERNVQRGSDDTHTGEKQLPEHEASEDENEDNENEDDEDYVTTISQSAKVSAQKQRHLAMFDTLQIKAVQERDVKPEKLKEDDGLSLKVIMAKQQSHRIIGNPRDYQMELFERAKAQNTIAVLDTGSGKTLIAVLLLRHVIDQELEHREAGKHHRTSFFLTDKVALAVQQQAVLKANLDQDVDLICGNMQPQTWTRETWDKHRKENMVVVCTPEVLMQALLHSFVRIEDINILIFDEAHHAKKDHPYARIIKDAYLPQSDLEKRPKIFGMTASPVDGDLGEDMEERARELESLLHATIATASDLEVFRRDFAKRPREEINRFTRLPPSPNSELYQKLYADFGDIQSLQTLFVRAKELASELGPWCSDNFWTFALSDRATAKREARMEQSRQGRKAGKSTASVDAEITRLNEIHEIVKLWDLSDPLLSSTHLSAKVMVLFEQLHLEYERPTKSKCLVFVQRRDTAQLLFRLAQRLGCKNLKPGVLTGTNSENVDMLKYSTREQALTMMKFRNQDLNCLFATSVAEEGIDVPDCNLVIRFDPCTTMIQYIQSRGRARHQNSKFIHFMERDNMQQEILLARIWSGEKALQLLCKNLPEDRKIDLDEHTNVIRDHRGKSPRIYTVLETGAKLTYDFSLVVLAHFVSCIPHEEEDDLSIAYFVSNKAGKFICEVVLPRKSPISSATGMAYPKKDQAKRSAAFEACIMLRKMKYLNEYLLPIYQKKRHAMSNAKLALGGKSNVYAMESKPTLWKAGRGTFPVRLFLTLVTLQDPWDRPVRPLGVLTRTKLPSLPSFPIFRINGQSCQVHVTTIRSEFDISEAKVDQLTWFSLTVFKDLFNKSFENNPPNMSYWLAPLLPGCLGIGPDLEKGAGLIDWGFTSKIHMQEPYRWSKEMPDEHLVDKFLIDPWDGGRRLFTKRIEMELKPNDPVPEGCVPDKHKNRRQTNSIIDYSVRLFKQSRAKRSWDETQPVIESEKTMHRLNVLADPDKDDQKMLTKCFVCPEPLKISHLPSDIAAMCMLFPSIIHRVESYLIAMEFADLVHLDIKPSLALEAVTKDSNSSEDCDAEKIKVQHGMGPNYERLELLGDCFLKMATSISVFTLFPGHDEHDMHVTRMCMLCNKNLLDIAKKNEWYKYIRSLGFGRLTWYPHGLKLLEGRGAKNQEQQAVLRQQIGDKTIADVCEALIGAALLSHYKDGYNDTAQFDNAVHAVHQFVDNESHTMDKWADYYQNYSIPTWQTAESTASQRDLVKKLQLEHPYKFKYPRLARCAFMHPSQPRMVENMPSYQRLEFLGDSLLDMTAVFYLFQKYPKADPQWLTEHKMAMVSNKFLSAVCVKIGFHKHLRHSQSGLEGQILHFIEEIEELERQSGGARDYWTAVRDPPKCLSDAVESYVGAMFVDSEYNYAEVQHFFELHIRWFFEDMSIYDTFAHDHPVTKLHSILSETMGCSDYRLMVREMPAVDGTGSGVLAAVFIHENTITSYQGTSTRYAKVKAASKAVELLQGMAPYEFRQNFNCTCKPGEADQEETQIATIGTAI